MSDKQVLEFTGERFTTECVREIWYEHWHRYAFILKMCKDKVVMDAASGEGYGSNLIADYATRVISVDIDKRTQIHAKNKYINDKVQQIIGSCSQLSVADKTVDVIISFETLEHLYDQKEMIEEFNRVLKDDGILIISSPEKSEYSDKQGYANEFHVKELYFDELDKLLKKSFETVEYYAQKLFFESKIWNISHNDSGKQENIVYKQGTLENTAVPTAKPMYYIAICTKAPLENCNRIVQSLFYDEDESVYQHYNDEVRRNINAGKVLKDYEEIMERQQKEIELLKAVINESDSM
ncbi:MAG: class I SAM-dependent methyltransferase [bacterium]